MLVGNTEHHPGWAATGKAGKPNPAELGRRGECKAAEGTKQTTSGKRLLQGVHSRRRACGPTRTPHRAHFRTGVARIMPLTTRRSPEVYGGDESDSIEAAIGDSLIMSGSSEISPSRSETVLKGLRPGIESARLEGSRPGRRSSPGGPAMWYSSTPEEQTQWDCGRIGCSPLPRQDAWHQP